jgi:hypothetical protein
MKYIFIINLFQDINANTFCYKFDQSWHSLNGTFPIVAQSTGRREYILQSLKLASSAVGSVKDLDLILHGNVNSTLWIMALFSLPQKLEFFHSLSITSIFERMHVTLNVGKKITNCTV